MPNQFPEIPILYEDDDLLVINKPPGIVVNRSQTQSELTVQDWIETTQNFVQQVRSASSQISKINTQSHSVESFGSLNDSKDLSSQNFDVTKKDSVIFGDPLELFKERSGVVHRLDKDTSGVLLIAKNPAALVGCMEQFKLRTTVKTYVALVHGKLQPQNGEINLPIGRSSKMRLQFAVREDGKASVTEYKVLDFWPHFNVEKVFENLKKDEKNELEFYSKQGTGLSKNLKKAVKMYQGFSLVELSPKTGRTHQIRVHLSHLHHPIVGDKVYSGEKRRLIDQVWSSRIFLHAKSLKIVQPRTKTELKFDAPLATDLEQMLEFLEK